MVETSSFQKRLVEVRQRIADSSPNPEQVSLVAVTKRFSSDVAKQALEAGLTDLGENYAQELIGKAQEFSDSIPAGMAEPNWHFIGRLQRNKVKKLAQFVSLWHTVDRPELATEIARRDPEARILVQVNTTGEGQKSGCDPKATAQLVDHARNEGLEVVGLMTMGPTDRSNPAPAFEQLRKIAEHVEVTELSMGMSADLELALAEGATMVRVGSALFGPRSPR